MSMQPRPLDEVPETTSRIAHRSFPKGTLAMTLRDELGSIFTDETFAHLFPKRGRRAEAPWRLAVVTVLQTIEHLTDRQAAEAVRARIDWKYALSLPLDDEGFDFSILSDFRQRLIDAHAQSLVLEPILTISRERGWLKAGGKQRTDSTAVIAAVRALNSLESVGESMRAALNDLAQLHPEWLGSHLEPSWFDRYVHRFEMTRFPKSESKQQALRCQVGEDVARLFECLDHPETPSTLGQLPSVRRLRQIFEQHYERGRSGVRWRDGPAVTNENRIVSPYDEQARSSRKRELIWLGYKVHLTETCDQDPHAPHLILQVHTVPATVPDSLAVEPILQDLRERKIAPATLLVDQGYMSAPSLVTQAKQGTQVIGPLRESTSWQAQAGKGYGLYDFEVDWQHQHVRCPQGHVSQRWGPFLDRHGTDKIEVRFPPKICQACVAREHCTTGVKGRILKLLPREAYDALEKRRKEQYTPAFQEEYARRAGIEGTISQAIRRTRLRRSPYRGERKTHLHHVQIAAGINVVRIIAHLQAQAQSKHARFERRAAPLLVSRRWLDRNVQMSEQKFPTES
ncbi:IS1182 family transposase [Ktedonospora formicarum]|uniref:IS1182 family transposase n=1 Tax=Ktedonospora formicarum TaxID=2778364 RepID=A0A8J3IEK3_9CHLR|nr:IS1182 family transposase [Ktedonospora formicarum]GHO49824.1 IS1182 family transposase [Ktedonospora formicarum]